MEGLPSLMSKALGSIPSTTKILKIKLTKHKMVFREFKGLSRQWS
jgi:hypothetical protein